jgi:hypothetical protein
MEITKESRELAVNAMKVIMVYAVLTGDYDKDITWNKLLDELHSEAVKEWPEPPGEEK